MVLDKRQRVAGPGRICKAGRPLLFLFLLGVAATGTSFAQTSPHGTLSIKCDNCHTSQSWKEIAYPLRFDHAETNFPLTGQHSLVQCRACHRSLTFARAKSVCAECHDDVHRTELGTLCDRCHSPQSWLIPDMAQRHSRTRFALIGAHATVSCQLCHTNQQKYEYVGVRTDCFGCHASDYATTTLPNHRTAGFGTDCIQCHSVTALRWETSFDHAQTGFPLQGAHRATPCSECHEGARFRGTPTECVSCHEQDYIAAVSPKHSPGFSRDCAACHTPAAWRPAAFDHNKTNFQLTGAHTTAACASCHANGIYAGTPATCGNAACHLVEYNATRSPQHSTAGFPVDCQICHSTTAWQPSTYDHDPLFPISPGSRHSPGKWTTCVDCHTVPTNFNLFSCIDCHEHGDKSVVDARHREEPRYTYASLACYDCHPRGN
jgi:hypothetical protein